MSKKIEQITEELVLKVLPKEYEMVDVEYVKEAGEMYLRILIDKDSGMTIDDCVKLSGIIGDEIDKKDYIKDAYNLEISSPGLDRKEFIAILDGLDEKGNVVFIIDEDVVSFDKKEIAKINLYLEF